MTRTRHDAHREMLADAIKYQHTRTACTLLRRMVAYRWTTTDVISALLAAIKTRRPDWQAIHQMAADRNLIPA